jgi:hypothetical protein
LRIELSTEDLHILKQALDTITIKGKDAVVVAKIIEKVDKAFIKAVEKESNG